MIRKNVLVTALLFLSLNILFGQTSLVPDDYVPEFICIFDSNPNFPKEKVPTHSDFTFDYPKNFEPDRPGKKYIWDVNYEEVASINLYKLDYRGTFMEYTGVGSEYEVKLIPGQDPKKTRTLATYWASVKYGNSYDYKMYDHVFLPFMRNSSKSEITTDYIYFPKSIPDAGYTKESMLMIKMHPVSKEFYALMFTWNSKYNKNGTFEKIAARLKSSFKVKELSPGFVHDNAGNVMSTTVLGTQTWMKENSITSHFRGFLPIFRGNSHLKAAYVSKGEVQYNLLDRNIKKYYNGFAASDPQGICPKGWHLPTKADFEKLLTYLQSQNWENKYGAIFSTSGGGYSCRYLEAGKQYIAEFYSGKADYLWTSSPASAGKIWAAKILDYGTTIEFAELPKEEYASCRCVKD